MEKNKCREVMDFIDEIEDLKSLPLDLKAHIKDCKSCKKYLMLTENLREYGKNFPSVNLKSLLKLYIKESETKRKRVFSFKITFVSLIILILISAGLLMFQQAKKNTNVLASGKEYTETLDYFYTIAIEF